MKKRILFTLLLTAAAVLTIPSGVQASQTGDTISIAFARDDPDPDSSTLDPTAVAGAPTFETKNWVNENGKSGTDSNLVRDTNGVATTTGASVTWSCNNTWSTDGRDQHNNKFTGDDYTLMFGYLDTGSRHDGPGTFANVSITGLPADMAAGYSVVLYTLGGARNRFAKYTVNGAVKYIIPGGDSDGTDNTAYNGPDYHEAIGTDPEYGSDDVGNYAVFSGLSGDVTILAEPRSFRAALNAVQVVKTP